MGTDQYNDESELVALLKGKRKAGMVRLYDDYSYALYGVINQIVREKAIAEDILQDSFIKIWENIDKYDPSKGRLYTWMLNVARNKSIDYIRSKQHRVSKKVQSIDNVVSNTPESKLVLNEDAIGLKKIVNKLDPKYKELIDQVYFKGYTQQEVSEHLNIPLGTVKTRIRTAIKQLQTLFK